MASDASPASPGPLALRIKLRYPDVATFIEKFSVNVGRSGLFLATRGLQPVGTELRFELRLADDQVVLAGVGRVHTVHEPKADDPDAPYGMAIEFMRATRESRELVLRMIEHRREHGLGEPALPGPPESAAGMARESAGDVPLPRRPIARPPELAAERPRQPRTRAADLVAALAARPAEDAGAEGSHEMLAALAAEPMDLRRIAQRARVIAANASDAELEALAQPGAAAAGYAAASGLVAGSAGAPAQPRRATGPFSALPPPVTPPPPPREPAPNRERFSSLPRRSDADAPQPGEVAPPAPAIAATSEEREDPTDPEPRRRRVSRPERLTRPPNVFARTRSSERAPLVDVDAEAERVVDVPDEHADALARGSVAPPRTTTAPSVPASLSEAAANLDATVPAFERVLAELEESERASRSPRTSSAGRVVEAAAMAAATVEAAATLTPPPASVGRGAEPVALDPLDQLALDDLDDADPGLPRALGAWQATVDETLPVTPINLDDSFEFLAEAELEANDLESGAARIAPSFGGAAFGSSYAAPARAPAPSPLAPDSLAALAAPTQLLPEEPGDPQTARSALAAAVSRPTWTRSKALDAPEAPPTIAGADLAPPTVPGRVPTREIDLESALDALDIEADAPVAPLQPRQPTRELLDDDDDFPIELEFDD